MVADSSSINANPLLTHAHVRYLQEHDDFFRPDPTGHALAAGFIAEKAPHIQRQFEHTRALGYSHDSP